MASDKDLTRDPLIRAFSKLLRAYREDADLTRPQLADALGCSYQWIEKLERGAKPSVATGIDLDTYFKIPQGTFQTLAEEIEEAGRHTATPRGFSTFKTLEAKATSRRDFEAQVIPGLLQTEAYAHAILSDRPRSTPTDDLLVTRLDRQNALWGDDPLRFTAAIDESALRRPIGGPEVMREQLLYLRKLILEVPTIHLCFLPESRPTWAARDGSFSILSFADSPDIAYYEGPDSSQFIRDPEDVVNVSLRFNVIVAEATSRTETLRMIATALETYT
ncbi:helix-turn-helix transcriptional regulator [Actinocorallia sp. A-T 12471]|uniref:helix-turn-helix domain-containing protein n=1 Tax=Actinocorallia sp. A-T 12471 TaxID=3089813 RepID=UPI0029CEA7C6|nr:helix-turn-helix transcriptional regulator [Actinocorallia sp. A-T 12471]MDX6745087.1 helix-turn-helix transcriptional regulator [Actinocorallia sp. A-T 12471]